LAQAHSGARPSRFRTIRYDLLKELTVALGIISVLVLVLAGVLSSPDVKPDTIQRWSQNDPVDFVTTATNELAGTGVSAQYGPPYNSGTSSVQSLGPLSPQQWAGVHQPVDPVNQFVRDPLRKASAGNPGLTTDMATFTAATAGTQTAWLTAYTTRWPTRP
jgi:hypothetical protein